MIARMHGVMAAAALAALGGCSGGPGGPGAASLDRYLQVVGARPANAASWPAADVPAPPSADNTWGVLSASRTGPTVSVEVFLADVPASVKVVSTGLMLSDGSVVRPETVSLDRVPTRLADRGGQPGESGGLEFSFANRGRRSAGGGALRRLQLTYVLDGESASVNGGTFTLVLGEVDGVLACRAGITLGVSTLDGGPGIAECVALEPEEDYLELPLPPARPSTTPVACFRLKEAPAQSQRPRRASPALVPERISVPTEPVASASVDLGPDGPR